MSRPTASRLRFDAQRELAQALDVEMGTVHQTTERMQTRFIQQLTVAVEGNDKAWSRIVDQQRERIVALEATQFQLQFQAARYPATQRRMIAAEEELAATGDVLRGLVLRRLQGTLSSILRRKVGELT